MCIPSSLVNAGLQGIQSLFQKPWAKTLWKLSNLPSAIILNSWRKPGNPVETQGYLYLVSEVINLVRCLLPCFLYQVTPFWQAYLENKEFIVHLMILVTYEYLSWAMSFNLYLVSWIIFRCMQLSLQFLFLINLDHLDPCFSWWILGISLTQWVFYL